MSFPSRGRAHNRRTPHGRNSVRKSLRNTDKQVTPFSSWSEPSSSFGTSGPENPGPGEGRFPCTTAVSSPGSLLHLISFPESTQPEGGKARGTPGPTTPARNSAAAPGQRSGGRKQDVNAGGGGEGQSRSRTKPRTDETGPRQPIWLPKPGSYRVVLRAAVGETASTYLPCRRRACHHQPASRAHPPAAPPPRPPW